MKNIKHIFLDWSGTLYDDFSQSYLSTKYVIHKISGVSLSKEDYRREFTIPVEKFYHKYNNKVCVEEVDKIYFDHFERRIQKAKLYPQVLEFLKLAKQKKIKLYIFSTVRQSLLENLISQFDIESFFVKVFGDIRDKERDLPKVLKSLSINKKETLFIGDLDHDILAGKTARIFSGAMTHGYYSSDRLVKVCPDFIFQDIESLIRFIKSFNKQKKKHKPQQSNRPIATVGALIFYQEKIFLIQTHKWGHTFGIPGGKIEFGESMIHAVKREIWEETGLKISNIKWAIAQDSVFSKEFYKENQHFILINFYATSSSKSFILNEEAESGIWVNPKDALGLNLNQPTRKLIEEYLSED